MKLALYWTVAKTLYKMVLRDLLIKAIGDPDVEWDDWVLGVCDKIFDYED